MTRTGLLLLLTLAFANGFSQGVPAEKRHQFYDVQHYKFNIDLNDKNDTIYGIAEISIAFVPWHKSWGLDLVSRKPNGKGMQVDSIKSRKLNASFPIFQRFDSIGEGLHRPRSVHQNDVLAFGIWGSGRVDGPFGANPVLNDTDVFTIYYHGVPEDGLIISKNKFGKRTFFSDNWPDRARNWLPCIDDPFDKASVEFIVTAPAHYEVVSNGIMVEKKDLPGDRELTHWKEDTPLPTKVMVIGVADFAVDNVGEVNGVPVSTWVFEQNKEKGFYDYAPARDILAFFMDYIGPYPYKKLANVQSKTIFGGMENASAIFYYENSVTGKRKEESLLSHEIVHQWFGDMATEKSFPHLWLSEGFATYLTHIYIESKYGTDSLNNEMRADRKKVIDFNHESPLPVVDTLSTYMKLLNANSYEKGGWVLHMLRRQLGDSIFHKTIRRYYATYAGRNADTHDFQRICEEVSGRSLQTFFRQWLYRPVHPKLAVEWEYKNKKLLVTVDQLQDPLFQFPLEIKITGDSGKTKITSLDISKKSQVFNIPVGEKTTFVSLDPNVSLLFEGAALPVAH